MNLYDIVSPMTMDEAKATKQRLDSKCWKGKHKEGTKVKDGVRVNNCVPNESVTENSWTGADNAWSSEHNNWTAEDAQIGPDSTSPVGGKTDEGWSNKMVAQRTGKPRTPYSVYIKGKEWKSFPDDDHAENVANKLRAKFKQEGRDPSVITIAATGYDKDIKEAGSPAQQAAIAIAKKKEQSVAEGLSSDRRAHLDSLIDAYRNATDPEAFYSANDDYDDPNNIIAQIRAEFGDKIADTVEGGTMHFPRPGHAWQQNDPMDPMFDKSPRVTKSGKVNRQDVNVLKKNIQRRVGDHTRPNLPEQGVAEASYINGHVEDPESLRWKQTSMSYEQAVAKFGKNNVKQDGKNRLGQKIVMVLVPLGEQAETDYSKRRQREKDVDAGKPVAKQRQTGMTDYQKRRAQQKREMELGESTNYWTKLQNERNNRLNTLVNELNESIKDIK